MPGDSLKVVYVAEENGEQRIKVGEGTLQEGGSVFIEDGADGDTTIRQAGEYLLYTEWSKVANNIYKKAVGMAMERVNKNGTK